LHQFGQSTLMTVDAAYSSGRRASAFNHHLMLNINDDATVAQLTARCYTNTPARTSSRSIGIELLSSIGENHGQKFGSQF
jgi:hypothetical protein